VTEGGSICMDLLTLSGWTAAYSIDAVLLQVSR
jgi:ubiquitin-protein ligase